MADTIREFVTSLGFKLDESSQRNFVGALEGATLRAKLLGDAIEAMARTVVNKVGEVAATFEQLFYDSQRLNSSAQSIRAFEYAVSQLGGTAAGAHSSLVDFSTFLRENLGATAAVAKLLNIPIKDTADNAKFLIEANEKLSHMSPALQAKYREQFHLGDYATSMAIQNPKMEGFYGDQLGRDAASGIDQGAMKNATDFEQKLRGVYARISTIAEGGESKLMSHLTGPMKKFNDWLDKNSPTINHAIDRMAASIGKMTDAWVDDLAKVKWDHVATDFDNVTKSISGFVDVLSDMIKDLDLLKPYIEMLKPKPVQGTVITEPIPGLKIGSGNPSSLQGLGGWWRSHAPSWLGGGGNTGGVTQNGVPVSDSNPLAVNVVRADVGTGSGSGWFNGAMGAVGRALGLSGGVGGGGVGGNNSGPHGGSRGIGGWWTPDRMSHAVDRLMKESGLTREGAAGLVARWSGVESPGGPTAVNPLSGAAGIGQWLGPRKDADAVSGDFDRNLTHAIQELNTTEKRAGDALRSARTGREGARGASMFERAEGYNGATGTDNFTGSTPAERVLGILDKAKAMAAPAPATTVPKIGGTAPLAWDAASPVWDQFNRSLLVGPAGNTDASKNVTSSVTNNITVSGSDPQSTAAMVGLHLDRTSNDISRNLQGAFQ
jgi:hypothetical protein